MSGQANTTTMLSADFICTFSVEETLTSGVFCMEEYYIAAVDTTNGDFAFLLREELDGYLLAEDGSRIII